MFISFLFVYILNARKSCFVSFVHSGIISEMWGRQRVFISMKSCEREKRDARWILWWECTWGARLHSIAFWSFGVKAFWWKHEASIDECIFKTSARIFLSVVVVSLDKNKPIKYSATKFTLSLFTTQGKKFVSSALHFPASENIFAPSCFVFVQSYLKFFVFLWA